MNEILVGDLKCNTNVSTVSETIKIVCPAFDLLSYKVKVQKLTYTSFNKQHKACNMNLLN